MLVKWHSQQEHVYYGGGGGMPTIYGWKRFRWFWWLTGPGNFFSKSNPLLRVQENLNKDQSY